MRVEQYLKEALEKINAEAEYTMSSIKDLSDRLMIEKDWIYEEFMKAMKRSWRNDHEPR